MESLTKLMTPLINVYIFNLQLCSGNFLEFLCYLARSLLKDLNLLLMMKACVRGAADVFSHNYRQISKFVVCKR